MFRENIVIAVIDAQVGSEPGSALPVTHPGLQSLITASASSAVDIVVLASSSEEHLDLGREYGAVDRKLHHLIQTPVAVVADVIASEDTMLDDESWLIYLHHSAPGDTAARLLAAAGEVPEGHETFALVAESGLVLGQLAQVRYYSSTGALPVPGTSLL